MVAVVRRNKTERMRARKSLRRNLDLRQFAVKCRLKTPYISHAKWRAPYGFYLDGFPRELSCVLMIECVWLFMFMMQVLSWLNECRTVNRSMNAWIGYYVNLLSTSLCLQHNRCCTDVILCLSVSLLLYPFMFKVLRPNLCHIVSC